jgi:hypothetical protein
MRRLRVLIDDDRERTTVINLRRLFGESAVSLCKEQFP